MPLYEYLCGSCGHRFEKIVLFSDPPLTVCPQCGKEPIEQLLSAPAVQFKGSGWYVTDYAKKNSSQGSAGSSSGSNVESSASAASENAPSESRNSDTKSSESKSERTSESKAESKPAPSKPSGGDKK